MLSRIDSISKDIDLLIRDDLSPGARTKILASFAREQLAGAEQSNEHALGRVPPHVTFVDGTAGAAEESVRDGGTIVYEFELAQQMLEWIAEQLDTHSPVKSGRYRRSHRVFVDGTEVNTLSVSGLEGSEIVFINAQPYARKIERGESPQDPDGVYEVVAELARRRFGNLAKIGFAYRAPFGGTTDVEAWAGKTKQNRGGRKIAVSHWNRRQPAIIVTMR